MPFMYSLLEQEINQDPSIELSTGGDIDPDRPPQLEMNVARSRIGCVCACSKQDNDDDMQSCTTAVENNSYYDGDDEWIYAEGSNAGDVIMTSADEHAMPATYAWEVEEIDAADLGTFTTSYINRSVARFQRTPRNSEIEVSEAVWGGSSPSASIMISQEAAPEHSMADSDILFGMRSSDVLRHAGNADMVIEYEPHLTILPATVDEPTPRLVAESLLKLSIRDRKQLNEFQSFDFW